MLKKNLKLIINNEYYSNLNKKIELNFRARSLKYFSKNINPIMDNSVKLKNEKNKIREIYTGGYLNDSQDEQKIDFNCKSIFDKINNNMNETSKISDKNINNKNSKRIQSSKPTKILLTDYAIESPFKYNPSYSFVYKNMPCIKINPKKYGPDIKQKVLQNQLRKKNLLIKEKVKKSINMKKCQIFGKVIKKEISTKSFYNDKYKNKNNHALSFDKNISRDKIEEINSKKNNNILTYIKPFNYIENNKHKIVNYKKMKSWMEIKNNQIHEVFGLTYTPKYTMIDKNIPSVFFDSKEKIKNFEKKNKLRKVISSYKIFKNFQIIDESKLSNKNSILNRYNLNLNIN